MDDTNNNISPNKDARRYPVIDADLEPELGRRDIERIEYLSRARDVRGFLRATGQLLEPLGFSNFALLLSRPNVDDVQKLWAYPELNREFYLEAGLHRGDLNVKHCLASDAPVNQLQIKQYVLSSPVENDLLAMNKEISLKLEEQGFADYFAFGFDSLSEDSRTIFSFSRQGAPAEFVQQHALLHLTEIRKLALAVAHVGAQKHGMEFLRGRGRGVISNAPLKLLDILANDNVNLLEAARILNIKEGTANVHVRTIKAAFGVPTVARAVAEALERGLICKRKSNF